MQKSDENARLFSPAGRRMCKLVSKLGEHLLVDIARHGPTASSCGGERLRLVQKQGHQHLMRRARNTKQFLRIQVEWGEIQFDTSTDTC